MNAVSELVLAAIAEYLIEKNAPYSWSEISVFKRLYVNSAQLQLLTHDNCVVNSPEVVTNRSPFPIQTHLHTTLVRTVPIRQTNVAVEASTICNYWLAKQNLFQQIDYFVYVYKQAHQRERN